MDPNIAKFVLPIARKTADGLVNLLGTSFVVGPNKFATAGHVTGPSDAGLVVIVNRVNSLNDYQDTTDKSLLCLDVKLTAYDPIRDVSLVEVANGCEPSLFPDNLDSAFPYNLDSADNVSSGALVVCLGFPHIDTGRLVLTQQASMVGARVLLGNNGVKTKHIVLNNQTRPGQSGGPVFSSDGTKVHAMIIGEYVPPGAKARISLGGVDPHTLHQTTHAVSAEYIRAMI